MKTKTLAVIGSRPQLLKVSREWADIIVDTGQHWDKEMTQGFKPDYNLKTTELSEMIRKLEALIKKLKPTHIIVVGDTRSTYAGAVVATELGLPLIHVEAGMRSYENIYEERVRHMVDHVSRYCLVADMNCLENLDREGIDGILVGDVEFDRLFSYMPTGVKKGEDTDGNPIYVDKPEWKNREKTPYNLLTLHRAELVDDKKNLGLVLKALGKSGQRFIWPIHPRTQKRIKAFKLTIPKNIETRPPVLHKELIRLIIHANKVVTDSGGVQREAVWLLKPTIIVRKVTEHKAFVDNHQAVLTGLDERRILWALSEFEAASLPPEQPGNAHENIRQFIMSL